MKIEELEGIASFEELLIALGKAMADKSIYTWRLPEDFIALYQRMAMLSESGDTLRLLATLGRLEAVVKKNIFDLHIVMPMLEKPPEVQSMAEGDDRYYLALYVSRFDFDWLCEWAIKNIWSERGSEKARRVFVDIALNKFESVEQLLTRLGHYIATATKSQRMVEGKICTRLLRTVKALRQGLQSRECNFDLEVGQAVDRFIGAPFAHLTISETEVNARRGLVEDVIAFLLDFIAQRFSVAIEANHYIVLKRLRGWCTPDCWQTLIKSSPVMDRLSRTLEEAVLILARQNIQDGDLLARLKESLADEVAFHRCCEFISSDGHIDQSTRTWLLAGGSEPRTKKRISSEYEVTDLGISREIGDLLLTLQQGEKSLGVMKDALTDLELFDPELAPIVQDFINHWNLFDQLAGKVARQIKVELVGSPGQNLDVDRKLFEVVNEGNTAQRRGLLLRPAVVLITDGKTRIIKKGVVKPQEDRDV